jgi:uncharacterized membrane protein YhfC
VKHERRKHQTECKVMGIGATSWFLSSLLKMATSSFITELFAMKKEFATMFKLYEARGKMYAL